MWNVNMSANDLLHWFYRTFNDLKLEIYNFMNIRIFLIIYMNF